MLINLRETEDRKIYVSSDFHLNHDPKWENPIWKMRGFGSAKEMTDGIIDSVNTTVRPNDILVFLGDWCLNTTIEQFNEFLDRIKCQNIYCLWGNHNNPHEKKIYQAAMKQRFPEFTEPFATEIYPFRYKNMVFMGHKVEAILGGQYCVLNHFPEAIWNEMKHGAWMLCGHSHYAYPATVAECSDGKILDVGWDGHRKPWSLAEIAEVMATKKVVGKGDHHQ